MLLSVQSWLTPPPAPSSTLRWLVSAGTALAHAVAQRLVEDPGRARPSETRTFSYRGVTYEVELSAVDARAMDRALAPYVDAARRVTSPGGASGRTADGQPSGATSAKDVRAWAVAEGIRVSQRGRLSTDLVRRYQEAHAL